MVKILSNRWEITIPLHSVDTSMWRIEEGRISRRKQVALAGSSIDNLGFGGGIIHETGKAHHIIIPYIDENSIPHRNQDSEYLHSAEEESESGLK